MKFELTVSEVRFMIKLMSKPAENGWYDIRNAKDGETTNNRMSVDASRLNHQKGLLKKHFQHSNLYKPTKEGWQALRYYYNWIALPLAKVMETQYNEQLLDTL